MDNAHDADRIEGGHRLFSISPAKRHVTDHSVEGSVCNGGKVTGFNKSKKHQLRKLDAVGEDNLSYRERGMGCVELRPGNDSCKRLKSPKMFFDDCNTVNHASVPRKLRSAIRKRSRESISRPLLVSKKLKRVADGVELLRKDGLVKSNLNKAQAEVCIKDGTLGLITKDEEEVAEALYALAVVFPDATKSDKKKLVDKQSGASSSALPNAEDSISSFKETEIPEAEVEPRTIRCKDDKPICSSNVLDSATVIPPSLNSTKRPDISVGKQLPMESGCHILEVNLPLTAFIRENECTLQRPCEFVVSSAWTELSLEHGSKLLKPEKSLASCNHPEIAFEPTGAASIQPDIKCTTEEKRDTGSSLWPGLSSRMSSDHERSCSAKRPAWFKSSRSVAQSPIPASVIAKKDTQVVIDSKKSWKRCSTHVYISRFIKVFQMTDGRDRSLVQYSQITTNEGTKQGPHDTRNGPARVRNGLIGSISTKGSGWSVPENDATEVRNAVILHKRLVQDHQQGSKTSGIHNAQKQSLDFLSLPTGSRAETVNSSNKPGQGPEALSPLPFPSLLSQYQPAVPFPMSQNYHSSTSFSGYPSAAAAVQQVHLPAFVGSMPPTVGASAPTSSQPEQLQQPKRAPLLMAHYKSGVAPPNVPNWQSGLSDLSPVFQHAQILFSPSRSSIEAIGSQYAPIIQQQQQSVSATALLPPKGQYHHLPSIYEGNGGGTHPVYADNLQSGYLRC